MNATKKQLIERRERNAGRRNFANSQTLLTLGYSEAQADAVSELCEFRHWLHCNQSDAFNPESTGYGRINSECSEFEDGGDGLVERISELFGTAPFARTDWPIDTFELFVLDDDWNPPNGDPNESPDGESRTYSELFREEQLAKCLRIMEGINGSIEAWLAELDRNAGTSTCPTGAHRE